MDGFDAHCHFWAPARGDYGWLDEGGPELGPLRRDFQPAELAALNGDAAVIAVQAAPSEAETRYLLGLAAAHPRIVGVVGWIDLSDPAAAGRLEVLAADPRLKGVRPMLQDLPDDGWIATAPHPAALAALVRLGLRFDALVMPRHLAALDRFVTANPGLPVVIDHAAKPHLARGGTGGGTGGEDGGWADGMARLARHPHIHCKLSGLLTEMSPAQRATPETALAVLRPVMDRLLDWFGPARLIWGSDWPVLTLAASHARWVEITAALLDGLSLEERRAILGGNGARFYGVEVGA